DFWQLNCEQPGFLQQFESGPRRAFRQKLREFFANAFCGNVGDRARMAPNGSKRLMFDLETESRRKSNRAQHAQLVFREPAISFADGANHSGFEIGLAADKIKNLAGVMPH